MSRLIASLAAAAGLLATTSAWAVEISISCSALGKEYEICKQGVDAWAAKTGNLVRDELGAGPGSRVAVLLPAHWQTAAVLLGVAAAGLAADPGPDPRPVDALFTGRCCARGRTTAPRRLPPAK